MTTQPRRFWPPALGPREPAPLPDLPDTDDGDDNDGAPKDKHTHRLPRIVPAVAIGMIATQVLTLAALVLFGFYIEELRQYRDQSQERARQSTCRILDALPASPLLDPAREMNRCGPGVPFEDLPPETQQQLREQSWAPQAPPVISGGDSLPGAAPRVRTSTGPLEGTP